MNIILFGPPGAGKGTQSDYLKNKLNLFKVSTGDLLRNEIKKNTDLGKQIKPTISKGSLVSDQIIYKLIDGILSKTEYKNRIIFDGYPRNLNQLNNLNSLLQKYKQKIAAVLNLNVGLEIIIKRISGRQVCSKCGSIFNLYFNPSNKSNHKCDKKHLTTRPDDNEETIRNRFETYEKDTLPILDFYKKEKILYKIQGESDISLIYKEIDQIIGLLEA